MTYDRHGDVRRNEAVHEVGASVSNGRRVRHIAASLIVNPEAGDVIPGSGGVRKLRWGVAGRGNRGRLRVIYFLRLPQGEIWMLTLYAKNVADNIPAKVLKRIKEEIDAEG
jgi:hypothetical protein